MLQCIDYGGYLHTGTQLAKLEVGRESNKPEFQSLKLTQDKNSVLSVFINPVLC